MPSLHCVEVFSEVSADTLRSLSLLPALRRLTLTCAAQDGELLSKMTALTHLQLEFSDARPPYESFRFLSSLRLTSFASSLLSDASIQYLQHSPLKALDVGNKVRDLPQLARCFPALESLTREDVIFDQQAVELPLLRNLRHLDLTHSCFTDACVPIVAQLKCLTVLAIGDKLSPIALAGLRGLPLERMWIHTTLRDCFTEGCLDPLLTIPTLRALCFSLPPKKFAQHQSQLEQLQLQYANSVVNVKIDSLFRGLLIDGDAMF